jgi:hypothetical protein
MTEHNPFIRHIVKKENEISLKIQQTSKQETCGNLTLKAVKVKLLGENDNEAIVLPTVSTRSYRYAEEFCELLQKRVKGEGFLKTLLLKRVGST